MSFVLRKYQEEAVAAGIDFLKGSAKHHAIETLATASGKSLIIANIVKGLDEPSLIFQPSQEILTQNYEKLRHYGFSPSVYSASAGRKDISDITLATIGSVIKSPETFKRFKYLLIDEAHNVCGDSGMYKHFIESLSGSKALGFTATPYRLNVDGYGGAMLKFLTRTRPRVFKEMIYYVQNKTLLEQGFLAPLKYYNLEGFDRTKLKLNSNGSNFDDRSVQEYIRNIDFPKNVIRVVNRLAEIRKNVLVFCAFIYEAERVVQAVPGSVIITGETPKKERERIIGDFKSGKIKVVVNVKTLTTGFDYPELETVVVARPTLSLSLYYQMIGRVLRPHVNKEFGMVVDMCGNIPIFGKVEDLWIDKEGKDKWFISSNGKQLTNVYYGS
jgi:DNA repair protein RadD